MEFTTASQRILKQQKTRFIGIVSGHLSKMSKKEAQCSKFKDFKNWIAQNVLSQYKMPQAQSNRLLNNIYGNYREADFSKVIDEIEKRDIVFDIFGDDLVQSLQFVESWLESQKMKTDAPVITATALYFQLSLMGARSTPRGFGSNDLVKVWKTQRGLKLKEIARSKAEAELHRLELEKRAAQEQHVENETLNPDSDIAAALAELDFSNEDWS